MSGLRTGLAFGLVLTIWSALAPVARSQKPSTGTATPVEYEGWRQYMTICARCHGDDAVGGLIAPDLREAVRQGALDSLSFHSTVMQGRKDQGMPNFEGVLNEDKIRNIYAYVLARAKKGLPAGRPKH